MPVLQIVGVVRVCLIFFFCWVAGWGQPADLVLRNGRLVTVERNMPEVRALAARAGKIVALGGDEQVQSWIGPSTRVIDLGGRLAIPGFIEGHGHFMALGASKTILNHRV